MERRLGSQFGDVRIHIDGAADRAARSLDAAAFTVGRDIYFRSGRFDPGDAASDRLLAHELVHVEQARRHQARPTRPPGAEGSPAETQARDIAGRVARGETVSEAAYHPPAGVVSPAPETWFRGDAVGAVPPKPGSNLHDFGEGLYLSDRQPVADIYADTRVSEHARRHPDLPPATPRTRALTIERASLGKVLDLTTDKRWNEFLSRRAAGQTYEQLIKGANENYGRFFKAFVSEHKIDLKQYDAIIGQEFVRGGKQVCIRNPTKIQEIEKLLKPIPRPPRGGGTSGSGSGGGKEAPKPAAPQPAKPAAPTRPPPGGQGAAPKPAAVPKPAAPAVKPPTASTASAAPKPARKPISLSRSSYASGAIRSGAGFATGALLGWMWSAMKKSAEETPTPKREVKEAGGFLKAIRDKEKLKIIDLVSSTIHDYAREGFAQERSSLTWQFFQAYGQIDALPEIGDRRAGISELQRETLRSINELETMLDNVNNALKLEKDFQEKIDAAKSLEKSVLYSSYWLFTYLGLSVEEIDQILTNLKVYAANHQLTLDALKRLRVNIAEARTDDIRLLGKLNAAWERGSLAGRR